jgi:RNA polymerase sigma-70 factor, ECF subfamily
MLGTVFGTVLTAAQDGDEAAFTTIFRDVQPVLLRYLHIIGPEYADDIAGETWIQVVAGLPGFRGDERSFRAWLFTIARHRAVDLGRSRARRPTVSLEESGAEERLTAADPADIVLERAATRAVLAAIATLPGDQGEIILLRVVVGLDTADVARIIGKTQGAVRVSSHRGLRRLAALAERAGVTL